MYNIHIDVRGPYPVLFHGLRAFRLEGLTRAVTIEQAVELLYEAGQLGDDDPLVQLVLGWAYARNN